MRRLAWTAIALSLAVAAPAAAQSASPIDRGWIDVDALFQGTPAPFSDAIDLQLNAETERIATVYPGKGGFAMSAGGGYRVWRRLLAGASVSGASRHTSAQVSADVPHPFFFNQDRHISGATDARRGETAINARIGTSVRLGRRLTLLVTAGPSMIHVRQTFVTNVQYAESYPYDTATFTSATTTEEHVWAPGGNGSADIFYLFSTHIGVGVAVRGAYGRARLAGRDTTIAGGIAGGGGLRVVF